VIETLKVNFRLISATHRNLRERVENEEFRNNLYYQISAFPLHISSLKEPEKRYIEWASSRVKNKNQLAKIPGVSERTL